MTSTPPPDPEKDEPTVSFASEEGGQPDYGRVNQPAGAEQPPPGWGSPPGYGPPPGQAPPPGYGPPPPGYYGYNPAAPYGVHPRSGVPFSDKQKLVAGLLQILVPLGIGRMYIGDVGLGVAQLLITLFTCGIGALWPFIDGIVMLTGDPVDSDGRPLRG